MKNNIELIIASEKFKSLSKKALADLNLTTSHRIIKEWVKRLNNEFTSCKKMLKSMQKTGYEPTSQYEYDLDTLLLIQCLLGSLTSFFNVINFIKLENNYKAWTSLVDSRDYLKIAESYIDKHQHSKHETKPGVDLLISINQEWENAFFPKGFVFTSPGMRESIGDCSVCGKTFIECDHIEGYIYYGKYCKRINKEIIEANHIAMVKVPRDKRCIFTTSHDDQGYQIDFFSRERIPEKDKPDPNGYQTIFLNIDDIDL